MENIRLLLVEDRKDDAELCMECVEDFNNTEQYYVQMDVVENLREALGKINSFYDGAIIDLRLSGDRAEEGVEVIKKIEEYRFRIPIIIYSATPDCIQDGHSKYLDIIKKDSGLTYLDIIKKFTRFYNTGLSKIMGGRGSIENMLYQVFSKNIMPQNESWMKYGDSIPGETEKALVRYIITYLGHSLETEGATTYPEEFYISPTADVKRFLTGSIVRKKDQISQQYVIMNPPCEITPRLNKSNQIYYNTDSILLAEIQKTEMVFPNFGKDTWSKEERGTFKKLQNNNNGEYYHFLPEASVFPGGLINFRHLLCIDINEGFQRDFELIDVQISPNYMKNILARFSSFYARQGQPDLLQLSK